MSKQNNKTLAMQKGDTKLIYQEGHLPTPDSVERYEKVLPGTLERLLQLSEKEQAHRHAAENKIIDGEHSARTRAQVIAFIFGLAFIFMAGFLIFKDKPLEGLAALITTLAAFMGPYIYSQVKNK
jgi:uncharacterized membrane protein